MNSNKIIGGYLLFEDGTRFPGEVCHSKSPALGEGVFNTSHTGYQEILTDPSYFRQIMVFTAPHIGNVGINTEDYESGRIYVSGLVVRSLTNIPRNWRSEEDLAGWLEKSSVPLLAGVDTRAVTLHIREQGAMRAGIFPDNIPLESAKEQVESSSEMTGANLANEVTCNEAYTFNDSQLKTDWHSKDESGKDLRVGVLDFGVKRNILLELFSRGCEVEVLPANITASEILSRNYDGILASNGPGDPAAVSNGIDTLRELFGKMPLFGICLGHQLISLAAGLSTFKLTFGHRGANHPVRRIADNTVEITSQNHGFAVNHDDIGDDWEITHINLNDQTVEGLAHKSLPIFSTQYHPEASPGPHDSLIYFDRFITEMLNAKA
ncbi:MAG: glutamine-hydrolyzing carbamoyl-phosphate synthase small subunit [Candidatus Electryonea clarkiae]|nr:glutamine-hydrolyzing carbamoyl-phosphate synthase small subunit [Candidatus Electryonea clarkiae]MDP8286174.1 glutamine-hydrolyzing carbamoyl-phosphate synthase small subunit [Candidatus Electryonea clarkiae]